ncbi:MAG: hypothetical protein O3C20_22570 [Verrucomicrobia bacterium]|nr:hypothetical protein [Verrucomicrobiota bacterium]
MAQPKQQFTVNWPPKWAGFISGWNFVRYHWPESGQELIAQSRSNQSIPEFATLLISPACISKQSDDQSSSPHLLFDLNRMSSFNTVKPELPRNAGWITAKS